MDSSGAAAQRGGGEGGTDARSSETSTSSHGTYAGEFLRDPGGRRSRRRASGREEGG